MSLERIKEPYKSLIEKLLDLLLNQLGDKLISVVVYGSVARGTTHEDSDIDILIVAESLPKSRMMRQKLFILIEEPLEPLINDLWDRGFHVDFSPIILSLEEASRIRPIYLDMVEDSIILYDKNGFFESIMDRLRRRLKELGARRVWVGDKWYWILKPDIEFGEVVEIE
ncbi:MAG: nucleotidyltransferase domain-containing protein [Candidatus Bathyarchaeota archaeon]|nr:nucleotidyltransferase domain-containing protein [Candidatus Bathyarchaeota archaeon]